MLKQSALYLLARAVPGAVNFLALLLYARMLGPGEFGRLTLVVGASTILNAATLYWVRASYLRSAADVTDDRQLRTTALRLNALIVLALLVLAGGLSLLGVVSWSLALAVVMLLGMQNACETQQEFLRHEGRAKAYGAAGFVRALAALLIGVVLINTTPLGYFGPVIGLAVGALLGLLVAYRGDGAKAPGRFSPDIVRQYAAYGLPLAPYFVTLAVLGNIDRFLLNHLLGSQAAGAYAAGYDMVQQTIGLLFVAISLAGLPPLFKAYSQGAHAWETRVRQHAALLLSVTVPLALIVTLYAHEITSLLLGPAYAGAAAVLPLIAWATVLAGVRGNYYDVSFQVTRQTGWQLPAVLVGLALNVTLGLMLIPRLGLLGAALASFTAHCAALLISAVLSLRVQPLPLPWREWGQIGVGAAVMLGTAQATAPFPFLLSASLALAAYVSTALIFHHSTHRQLPRPA